jgi:hypothetical protein
VSLWLRGDDVNLGKIQSNMNVPALKNAES